MYNNDYGVQIVFGIMLFVVIGFVIGSISGSSLYAKDTYYCNVRCPDRSHSIQFKETCYCGSKYDGSR